MLRQPILPALILVALVGSFLYYTLTILTPLLPETSPLHDLFPSRKWAVAGLVGVLLLGIALVLGWMGWQGLMEVERREKRQAAGINVKKER